MLDTRYVWERPSTSVIVAKACAEKAFYEHLFSRAKRVSSIAYPLSSIVVQIQ
jgi:hypothetical protein